MTENTFYMAVAWFSETYGQLGVASDKLHGNQTHTFCRWTQPDPNAVTNLPRDSPVGASTSSVPEFDTGQAGRVLYSPQVINTKPDLGVELLAVTNGRGPANGCGVPQEKLGSAHSEGGRRCLSRTAGVRTISRAHAHTMNGWGLLGSSQEGFWTESPGRWWPTGEYLSNTHHSGVRGKTKKWGKISSRNMSWAGIGGQKAPCYCHPKPSLTTLQLAVPTANAADGCRSSTAIPRSWKAHVSFR